MDEVLAYLKENPVFFLATVEGDQPRVRPFGFVMQYDGRLCFCTNNKKDVYRQLIANPSFEISACGKNNDWLRLKGRAVFCTGTQSKRAALDAAPSLAGMYRVDDGIFEIFCAEDAEATFYSFSGTSKTVRF